MIAAPSSENQDYVYRWTQGGCIVDNYLYTFMITDSDTADSYLDGKEGCIIIKSDLSTGQEVKRSAQLMLGHANDATYNPDENVIVVADCTEPTKVHYIDPENLTLIKTVTVDGGKGMYAIAYDRFEKQYIGCFDEAGHAAQYMYYYDSDFKLLKTVEFDLYKTQDKQYAGQGIFTDGVYVYMLEYNDTVTNVHNITNMLAVYSVETGELLQRVDLGIGVESESIGYYDGSFYVSCQNIYWNGLELYRVSIN